MALETDRREPDQGSAGLIKAHLLRAAELGARFVASLRRLVATGHSIRETPAAWLARIPYGGLMLAAASRAWVWLRESAPVRFISATLARRIFVSNLLGLLVLLGGITWLSLHQEWLIKAKRESLRVQGEIIAAAIAASASVDTDRLTFDPERLSDVDGARFPIRDDAFAAFEMPLPPEKIGRVVARLIKPHHNTRARIYDRDGNLVIDTLRLSGKIQPDRDNAAADGERISVKTWWTRLTDLFDGSDIKVYREIGSANGNSYKEVRLALGGTAPEPMLLINDRGKRIVSLAVPIQRKNTIVGVLLLSTRPGEIDEVLAAERWIILSLAVMALLATLMASLMLARTIAGPVRRLSEAAEQVSQSISARADLPDYSGRQDEVGQMANSFKRMTTALYRRIEASEKFAADVAHELKNPLTAARSTAEAMYYARTTRAARGARAASPRRVETAQPADHRCFQCLAPRRGAGPAEDSAS